MELGDFLNRGEPGGAGAPELERIVSKARRRFRTFGFAGLVVALLVGGGIGFALNSGSGNGPRTVTAGADSAGTSSSGTGASSSAMIASPLNVTLTHLFTNTEGQFTVRGFLNKTTISSPLSGGTTNCPIPVPSTSFQAEVSSAQMVGTVYLGNYSTSSTSSDAITAAYSEPIGIAEGGPAMVVDTNTSSAVTEVRVTFAWGAVVSMAPVSGYGAMAAAIPSTDISNNSFSGTTVGTLDALNAAGTVLQSVSLNVGPYPQPTPIPLPNPGSVPSPVPYNGTASGGTAIVCCGRIVSPPATMKVTPSANSGSAGSSIIVCPLQQSGSSSTQKSTTTTKG